MDPSLKIILVFVDLIAPLAVGYWLRRRLGVQRRAFDALMVFNIMTLATALALFSVWVVELNLTLLWLPILGVVMQVVGGAAGALFARGRHINLLDRGSYILATMLSNRGTAGMLTVFILFREDGYAYAQLVMLLAPMVVYLFAFPLSRHYYERHHGQAGERRLSWRLFVNRNQIPVLGLAVGAALNVTGVPRPAWLETVVPVSVHVSTWLFLVPVGAAIDFREVRRHLGDFPLLFLIKFLLTPAIVSGLAWALGLRGSVLWSVAILAMAPTAINSVVVAQLHDLNTNLAMSAFVVTTIGYLVLVLPALLLIFGVGS